MDNFKALRNNLQSQMPAFNAGVPQRTNYSTPAGEEVIKGLKRTFKPIGQGGGLLDRAAGAGSALISAFGLPQEGVSRVASLLTGGGGAESTPSDLLQRWTGGSFGSNPYDQLGANMILDPLSVVPFGLMMGATDATKGLNKLRELEQIATAPRALKDMVMDARGSLLFMKREQAEELAMKAGIYAPVVQDPELKSFYFNLSNHKRPSLVRQQLREALQGESTVLYNPLSGQKTAYNPYIISKTNAEPVWEVADENLKAWLKQPWDEEGLKLKEQRNMWVRAFGSTQNHSPFLKSQVNKYDSAKSLAESHLSKWSENYLENTGNFDLHQGAYSAQNRALTYRLKGMSEDKLKLFDEPAYNAYLKNKNVIDTAAAPLRSKLIDELRTFNFAPRMNKKFPGVSKDFDEIFKGEISDDVWKWLTGYELNPRNADPSSIHKAIQYRVAKERFFKPTEKDIAAARSKLVEEGKMFEKERSYSEMVSKSFIGGEPSKLDKYLQDLIINNKETIRGRKQAQKLWQAAQGGSKLARARVGTAESLITAAEKGVSPTSALLRKGTKVTYGGLLGLAIDSGVRNVVGGTLNTLTEYGLKTFENIIPAFKAANDKRWAETLDLGKIVTHSNGMLEEWMQKTPFLPENPSSPLGKRSWYDIAMTPMQRTENFNRALSFFTALDHNIKTGGMSVGEAIRGAEEAAKKLQFGYSPWDMSPYMNNPLARAYMQFQIYPTRQLELMGRWAHEEADFGKIGNSLIPNKSVSEVLPQALGDLLPKGIGDAKIKSKLLKYLLLTGAVLNTGARHGVDMSQVLGVGLGFSEYPNYVRYRGDGVSPSFTLTPPVVKLMLAAKDNATNLFNHVFGTDTEYDPQKGWNDFSDMVRLLVPGGRYTTKVAKNIMEFTSEGDATKSWGWVANFLGAKHDPSISGTDRMLSVLGFNPTSFEEKRDQLSFLNSYKNFYLKSVSQLNKAVMNNQDYTKLQRKLQKYMMSHYGPQLERLGAKPSVLKSVIRPSEMAYIKRAKKNGVTNAAMRSIMSLPVEVRNSLNL